MKKYLIALVFISVFSFSKAQGLVEYGLILGKTTDQPKEQVVITKSSTNHSFIWYWFFYRIVF